MVKDIRHKTRLKQIENNVKDWKKEGYELPEIERLIDFVKEHRKPSVIKKLFHIGFISFLIAVIIILASFPYAIYESNEIAKSIDKNSGTITINKGYPFKWLSIQYKYSCGLDIDTMFIFKMSNLFIDFILYLVGIFICLTGAYFLYSKYHFTIIKKSV